MFKLSKNASLNLSINAIVIVVLAMTLLGLGLGFIRGMFQNIGGLTTDVQEQVREQITAQLRTTGEKISFPRSLQFSRGEQKVITMGLQNTGIREIYFKVNMTFDLENSDTTAVPDPNDPDYATQGFKLRWDKTCLVLGTADAEVYGINVNAPRSPGTFALKANVFQYSDNACTTDESVYAGKLSFVTVG